MSNVIEYNPFVVVNKVEVVEVLKLADTAEKEFNTILEKDDNTYYYSENITSCTLYFTNPEVLEKLLSLNHIDLKLLMVICKHLAVGKSFIKINRESYMNKTSLSINSFYKAKKQLIKANFIRPRITTKDTYWINPHYFYSGNRANKLEDFYKTVIKRKFKVYNPIEKT